MVHEDGVALFAPELFVGVELQFLDVFDYVFRVLEESVFFGDLFPDQGVFVGCYMFVMLFFYLLISIIIHVMKIIQVTPVYLLFRP